MPFSYGADTVLLQAHNTNDNDKFAMNEYDDVDRTGGFEQISAGDGNHRY